MQCKVCLFVCARDVVAPPVFAPTPNPARANLTSRLSTRQREGAVSGSAEEEEEARHQENLRLHRLLHPVLLPLCDNKVTARPRTSTHRLLGASSHLAVDAFTIMAPATKSNNVMCHVCLHCCVMAFILIVCACVCMCVACTVAGRQTKGLKLSCHSCHARQAHSI